MAIVDMGGTSTQHSQHTGRWHASIGTVLTDGTIITLVASDLQFLRFRYSTDEGSTWTDCATQVNVQTNSSYYHTITSDEFDYLYVGYYDPATGQLAISAYTFSGTNVVLQDSEIMGAEGTTIPSSMVAVDNPTRSGDHTHVAIAYRTSGTQGRMRVVDYNRDTDAFDSSSDALVVDETIYSRTISLLMENTVTDSRVAAAPSSPVGAVIFHTSSTSLRGIPLSWDGSSHLWQEASAINETVTTAASTSGTAVYDPTIDRIVAVGGESATVGYCVTGDMPLTTWTARADIAYASGATKQLSLGVTTDGLGGVRVNHMENDDTANIDLGEHVWVEGTPAFGSETVVSAVESHEDNTGAVRVSAWSPGGHFAGFIWISDAATQARLYYNWTDAAAGGALQSGWGFIPI